MTESGTTDTFEVKLDSEPISDVVLTVTSGDVGEATVDKAALTFTKDNWDTAQTVTVQGVDDDVDDGDQTTQTALSVDDAKSDDTFDPLADQAVAVVTADDDTAGFTITISGTDTKVTESGTTDTFAVKLNSQPLSDVVLDVTSGNTNEATVDPAQLTFTAANWDHSQVVTVAGVDDIPATVDGDQVVAVSVSVNDALSDDAWDPLADQQVSVTNQDNDAPGFILSKTIATVSESGTTDTFTVVLKVPPLSNVVLEVSSGNTDEVTSGPARLTFTPDDWDQPQVVTVSGVDDNPATVDGDQVVAVNVSVNAAWSDDAWDSLTSQQVSVTNQDNDVAGSVLSKTAATVSESGTTDTFTVVLTARPLSNVVLDVSSRDTYEVTADPSQLTFAPGDWEEPRLVTLTGVEDNPARVDGDQVVGVNVSVNAAWSDDAWDSLTSQQVSVTNQDNDAPGFALSKTIATVSEGGTKDTFTVLLTARPLSDVMLDVSSQDMDEVTADPVQLIFAPDDWDQAQVVTLTGVDDSPPRLDGDQLVGVSVSVNDALSDDAWDPLTDQQVSVTNQDNDVAGFVLSKTEATVSESGTTDTFTVALTAPPLSNVILDVSSEDRNEVTTGPGLIFSPRNWDQPQVVTVTGMDDSPATLDGDQVIAINLSVYDAWSDDAWDPLPSQQVSVTNQDNDVAGFVLSKTEATVSESGTTDTFTVVLTACPLSNVVLDVSSGDTDEVTTDPPQLSFPPGDWDQPHVVTVAGVDDRKLDGDQTTAVRVSVDDAESNDYFDDLADQTVLVATVDIGYRWHNHKNPYDVTGRDGVTPEDVLILVLYINSHPGDTSLPPLPETPPPFYDVNGDDVCSPADVLSVITFVNSQSLGSGNGESVHSTVSSSMSGQELMASATDAIAQSAATVAIAQPPLTMDVVPRTGFNVWRSVRPANDDAESNTANRATQRDDSALGLLWQTAEPTELDEDLLDLDAVLSVIAEDVESVWAQPAKRW